MDLDEKRHCLQLHWPYCPLHWCCDMTKDPSKAGVVFCRWNMEGAG